VTVFVADTINVWDIAACAYCSATFSIWVRAASDSIYIVQTDTAGQIALCGCLFDIQTSISGLPAGIYWIVVYRDLLKKYGYPSDTHQFIGSIQVDYQPGVSASLSWDTFQSSCLSNSVPSEAQGNVRQFVLYQNYPNPFNPTTTIRFATQRSEFVTIKLYDLIGREVRTLWAQNTPSGSHSLTIVKGDGLSSGPYYCRMSAGNYSQTVVILLLR